MHACVLMLTANLLLQAPGATPPPGWREATSKALDLTLEGKDLEVIAMWEKWVAQYPKFGEARMMLGAAHESRAKAIRTGRAPGDAATVSNHYKIAILQTRRAIDDAGAQAPFDWMRSLIDMHHPLLGAGPQDEYERLIREAVKRYPADPYAHGYLITMLADQNQPIAAAATAARAAMPKTADARADLAGFIAFHVRDFGRLMNESGLKSLVAEASSLVDEALKMNPKHADALRTKARIAELRK